MSNSGLSRTFGSRVACGSTLVRYAPLVLGHRIRLSLILYNVCLINHKSNLGFQNDKSCMCARAEDLAFNVLAFSSPMKNTKVFLSLRLQSTQFNLPGPWWLRVSRSNLSMQEAGTS